MPITLDGQTVPMPKEFAPTVMKNAFEASVIGQLTSDESIELLHIKLDLDTPWDEWD